MDINAVSTSYARWAPIYDRTFGAVTNVGRKRAVEYINTRSGTVLEVGVGTGLALEHYDPAMQVSGIDFSEEMLAKARDKVQRLNWGMSGNCGRWMPAPLISRTITSTRSQRCMSCRSFPSPSA